MGKSSTNDVKRVEHTPGPWVCEYPDKIVAMNLVESESNNSSLVIATVRTGLVLANQNERGCTGANAHLIAAAPDLLEALELAVATIDRLGVQHGPFNSAQGTLDVARAAIAKARGQ